MPTLGQPRAWRRAHRRYRTNAAGGSRWQKEPQTQNNLSGLRSKHHLYFGGPHKLPFQVPVTRGRGGSPGLVGEREEE